MELFLIRHAIALPRSPALPDTERPLTTHGRQRFTQIVHGLQVLGVHVDCVHHSPWLRAVETAELLQPLLSGEMLVTPTLACTPGKKLLGTIQGGHTALVGHEPWMSDLLAWLTTGVKATGPMFLFKKGGVAWLEGRLQPGHMSLRAFLPPKVLVALAQDV